MICRRGQESDRSPDSDAVENRLRTTTLRVRITVADDNATKSFDISSDDAVSMRN
jgi:hypothetical protein